MSVLGAGTLCHRVRIQQPTTGKDSLGAPSQTWTDVAAVWADIQPLTGREALIAGRIAGELTHQITVRYQPVFDDPQQVARLRVVHRGRTFSIHAALNDDEDSVAVILLATEGVSDG